MFSNQTFQTYLQTPTQAANVFTQPASGMGSPKQRNVYIVRFISPQLPTVQSVNTTAGTLTYVIKTMDRPKLNMKVEELNEYNKRRQVLTGYKLEPVRLQFYDSGDGSALAMWIAYGRYYYGDLNVQSSNPGGGTGNPSYGYDATSKLFNDPKQTGFGFTARNTNPGASANPHADPNDMYFFDRIELYQFFNGNYDLYYLIHPRIQMFEPDDVDYENSGVSTISMSVVYENLQYFPQQNVQAGSFPEFQNLFDGNPVINPSIAQVPNNNQQVASINPYNSPLGSLFGNASSSAASVLNYRFGSIASTGALGIYGNFGFGPSGVQANINLSTMALGNPILNASLLAGTSTPAVSGIDGGTWDVVSGPIQTTAGGYGTMGATVATGLLGANVVNNALNAAVSGGALSLSPAAFGLMNSQQTGTAQFGFNSEPGAGGLY